MKKVLLVALALLVCLSLISCTIKGSGAELPKDETQKNESQQNSQSDEDVVSNLVKGFGSKLQAVSLLAPKDILEQSMKENYGNYVSQTLIEKWIKDPINAPGRLTSSPWPDRIELQSVKKVSDCEYSVKGEVIEITSTEKDKGGIAAKRPISLTVQKVDSKWLITAVELSPYE